MKTSRCLTVTSAARTLSVSKKTVYRLIAEGVIPALRIRGSLRIPENALMVYLEKQIDAFEIENGLPKT